jgi:acetyl esterase
MRISSIKSNKMKRVKLTLLFLNLFVLICFSSNLFSQQNISPETFIYRQVCTDTLKAYVFKPLTLEKEHPAILLFHGGGWRLGDASWTYQRAKEFTEKGIVSICIDYRLANNGLSPIDGVEDACYAFAWARDHAKEFGIDKKRVAGYGVSAGGHLVACAATLPFIKGMKVNNNSRPNAMLLYSPALNMAHDEYFNDLMQGKGDPASYSPSEYISNKLPPTLIIQGEQDSIVLTSDARAFSDAAIKAGAKCALFVYPGVGHLLTRNIKVQYKDFDSDPAFAGEAHKREDDFLQSLGYIK